MKITENLQLKDVQEKYSECGISTEDIAMLFEVLDTQVVSKENYIGFSRELIFTSVLRDIFLRISKNQKEITEEHWRASQEIADCCDGQFKGNCDFAQAVEH